MSDEQLPQDRPTPINVIVGASIIGASIAAAFWWGVHFRVFGSKIEWVNHPEQIGFVGWILAGAFGAGFMLGGARTGIKALISLAVLVVAAAVIGAIRAALS
ncbi:MULTISPECIES: hypothetical protein [unclassified Sphingomonas]|uniref:hypothetical protein n=1 Tax=unclassified Sphingomonas TaxID=196159 RepID=UPI000BD855D7|nr:MAG: hypothetical protein B7Y98_11630 [Sphingomonas sp. 32-62-10]